MQFYYQSEDDGNLNLHDGPDKLKFLFGNRKTQHEQAMKLNEIALGDYGILNLNTYSLRFNHFNGFLYLSISKEYNLYINQVKLQSGYHSASGHNRFARNICSII